jgi:hypothetical protein
VGHHLQDLRVLVSGAYSASPQPLGCNQERRYVGPAYFSTMHGYVDEMAAVEKALDDGEIVSYILNGMDADYNSLIEHVNGMIDPISPETLYVRLLDTEVCLAVQKAQRDQKEQYHMLANAAARGGNGGNKQQTRGGHQGFHGGPGRNNGGNGHPGYPNNPNHDHQCQVCGKLGHTVLRCWKRFNKNYSSPEKTVNSVVASYNLDLVSYADSATTDHITGDLDKFTMKENYGSQDQVHVANSAGMTIKHIGHSTVSTIYRHVLLKNVLHVPHATHKSCFYSSTYLIIMSFLSFSLIFLLRIGTRGAPSCKVKAEMAFTPSPPWNPHRPASCV